MNSVKNDLNILNCLTDIGIPKCFREELDRNSHSI